MNSNRGSRSWRDEEEEDSSGSCTARKASMAGAAVAGVPFLAGGIPKLKSKTNPPAEAPSPISYTFRTPSTSRGYQYSNDESESDDDTPYQSLVVLQANSKRTITREKWEKPPPGFYKLNVDGSDRPKRDTAGAGCIIRDHHGSPVIAAAYSLHRKDASLAEAEALKRGLELAKMFDIKDLYIEGDSMEIIDRVKGLISVDNPPMSDVIRDITELTQCFRFWEIRHVNRSANRAADALSKRGARFKIPNQQMTWKGILPTRVANLVEKDRV